MELERNLPKMSLKHRVIVLLADSCVSVVENWPDLLMVLLLLRQFFLILFVIFLFILCVPFFLWAYLMFLTVSLARDKDFLLRKN